MSAELTPETAEIDALLRQAARAFAYPPTPAVAARVQERLQREGPGRRLPRSQGAFDVWSWRPSVRVAIAAAVVVLLVAGAALAVPRSRDALADLFGFGHVRVEVGPVLEPAPTVVSPASFARPSTTKHAKGLADFALRFPTRDGKELEPDAVYVQGESSEMPVVIFVYEDEGFDLYQTRQGYFGKGAPDPSLIHEIAFGGHPALWIDEGGHIASFLDEQGRVVVESRRTVDRATLLWEQDGITYRLETSLSQEEAIRVAESLR